MEVNNHARPFALIDRDGTLIVQHHYLADPDLVELLPNSVAGLRALRGLGYGIVVVSNQSAVGRGLLTLGRLNQINERLIGLLADQGIAVDGIYFCPHQPEADCPCRKPRPGMALQAAAEHAIDLARSCVIGDAAVDIGLGRAIRATTLLVRTGYGPREIASGTCNPDAIVDDLLDAARWLTLNSARGEPAPEARA